jgi:hypothetical protein
MDQFDEYGESTKAMPVPAMMNIMAAIYTELARDPVMSGPAMYLRQALLELDGLCTLARQVQMEEGAVENASKERPNRRRASESKGSKGDDLAADNGACMAPLASLQPYSFLKQ